MSRFLAWLDDRTGYRDFVREALYENIPGGARWRYVWGSTLVFTFAVQVITGTFLWMCYSPSAQTAWESVYFIQYQMQGGWLLRGIHHYTAQAMVVLLVLHLMQVVIDGAYRAPREVNFWLGLVLMQIVLGLSLTGYLLPWDQKGYWATRVATNLLGLVPMIGYGLQQLVVGGSEYGHHTLTRFFALHAGVLPGLLIVFLVLHVYMFRRHGICHKLPHKRPESMFWPDQLLKDAVACLAVLIVVLALVVLPALSSPEGVHMPAGRLGAELGAPADPSHSYNAARPEWYFLFLFQLLKYFPGESEPIGAIVIPSLVMLVLFAMPILGRWKLGHVFNIAFLMILIFGGVVPLTYLAWRADHYGPDSAQHLADVEQAQADAERALELAQSPSGIPQTGAITLMRNDPKAQGPKVFEVARCATCHGQPRKAGQTNDEGAPDLLAGGANRNARFATREWLRGLLDPKQIDKDHYFGNTKHREGEMAGFVKGDLQKWDTTELENVVIALSAEAKLRSQEEDDARDQQRINAGIKLLKDGERCAQCHKFHEVGELGMAPDLTGYGSRGWLIDFISNPADERFYGKRDDRETNDRMPQFGKTRQLTPHQIELLADWLRQDWYEEASSRPDDGP